MRRRHNKRSSHEPVIRIILRPMRAYVRCFFHRRHDARHRVVHLPTTPSPHHSTSPATHDIPHFLALVSTNSATPSHHLPHHHHPAQPTTPLLLLHSLRPLHRSIHLATRRAARAYLQRLYRRGVDGLNIERASWQYEKDWFVREIERQRQYVSTEKEIELIQRGGVPTQTSEHCNADSWPIAWRYQC